MVSLVIIASNSSARLPKTINSVKGFVKEVIVVVDTNSVDDTFQEAKRLADQVVSRKLDSFATQKNHGVSLAHHDWILSLDSDEEISPAGLKELKALNLSASVPAAYSFPRLNYFFNQPIYHSNWGPSDDRHIRLFNRKLCSWQGSVHEEVITTGPVEKLTQPIQHYSLNTVSEFIDKINRYTSLETKFTFPVWDFLRRYIWHQGFRDGLLGLFMCYLMLIYHTTVGIKLWLKNQPSA